MLVKTGVPCPRCLQLAATSMVQGETVAHCILDYAVYGIIYYEAAYRFEQVVYVLHVFQKKSKSGIATPQTEIDLAYSRYQTAQADYETEFEPKEQK